MLDKLNLHFLTDFKRWVVTAGHCLDSKTDIEVSIGITEIGDWEQQMIAPPSHQYIYPNYAKWIYLHDIGVYSRKKKPLEREPDLFTPQNRMRIIEKLINLHFHTIK